MCPLRSDDIVRETLPFGGHHLYDLLVARKLVDFYATQMHRFAGASRVLDVGSGPGRLVAAIATALPKTEVQGVDLDPAQVRIARRKQRHLDVDFTEASSQAMPFPDGHFDVTVTSESYHHWSDPEGGLREMHRVTRPGGKVMVWETCGDITKQELASWTGWVPPLWIHVIRRIFTTHGYTTQALQNQVTPRMEREFGPCKVERVNGWWVITARA